MMERNMKKSLAVLICLGILTAQVRAREVPIVVLHTCDLHGNILPTESYEGQTNVGGIARCATVIRQVREHEKNVLRGGRRRYDARHAGQFPHGRPGDGEVSQPTTLRFVDMGQS